MAHHGLAAGVVEQMKQAIIELTAAINRLADAAEKLTEKGGKESSPLIPPLKESPKKKPPPKARARELNCSFGWAEKKYYADRKLLQKYFCVMGGK